MTKKTLLSLIIILTLFTITGCKEKTKINNSNSTSNNNSNEVEKVDSIVGTYVIEKIESRGKEYTAKEWKDMTTLDYSLEMKNDNTAITIMSYNKNMNGEIVEEKNYYTYDEKYFYGTNNKGTEENVKYYSYEYKDGILKLSVIGVESNDVYTYKKK